MLADPPVRDVSFASLLFSGDCMASSDLASLLFGPLPSEALMFHPPQPDDERTLQEWCSSELVSLTFYCFSSIRWHCPAS